MTVSSVFLKAKALRKESRVIVSLIQLATVFFVSFFLNVLSWEFLLKLGIFLNVFASSNNEQFPGLCLYLSVFLPFVSPPPPPES